jgi:hypothetical protein
MISRWIFDRAEIKTVLITGGFWLLKVLRLQFFLMLVSWPILLWWGLPISLLSPLGNLLFSPFLFCFLILASLIFFSELVYCAPPLLYVLLEKLTALWLWCCHLSTTSMLVALPRWCTFLATTALIITALLIYHPRLKKPLISTSILALLIVLVMQIGILSRRVCNQQIQLAYGGQTFSISHHDEKIIMKDPGLGRCRKNMNNWISYTLLPFLSIHYGAVAIDEYHCVKLTQTSITLLELLCQKKLMKKIVIDSNNHFISLQKMRSLAAQHDIEFVCQ